MDTSRTREAPLDGLRAFAVGLVVLFHYSSGWSFGGFVGVDLFFVLSGFLITSLLLREIDHAGSINFANFYLRRAARLTPALVAVAVFVLIAVSVVLPELWRSVALDEIWVLTYLSNWKRAFVERFGESAFFNHAWSLAIEEQFYLTWPLVLAFWSQRCSRRRLVLIPALLIVAVAIWRIALTVSGATSFRLYHAFDTRIDELLAGCCVAIALSIPEWRARLTHLFSRLEIVPIGCLITIPVIGFLFPIKSSSLPLFGFTLITAFAVVVLLSLHLNQTTIIARIFSMPPIRYLGIISYGIYLWHIPIKSLMWYTGMWLGMRWKLLAIGLTIAAAALSFHFLERKALAWSSRMRSPVAPRAGGTWSKPL